jgi:hypothetical protein
MPDAPKELRDKFIPSCPTCGQWTGDGIEKAEKCITSAGGTVVKGMIDVRHLSDAAFIEHDVSDAVLFLVMEWDYGVHDD